MSSISDSRGNAVRVFVSSTWEDLQPERRAVEVALNRLDETQFVGMEYFGSRNMATREISLVKLEECQLFVGIIGGRYGSGIAEEEFQRARDLKIPRFIYVKQEPGVTESDPDQAARRMQFIAKIDTTHTRFATPDDLAARLTSDLHHWLVDTIYKPRIRQAGFAASLADAYLSPEPVYERLNLGSFVGRDWLRSDVDDFLTAYDRGYFILEADAGMGKSAFLAHLVKTRRWIHHFVELARGQDGVQHGLRNLAAQIVFRWTPELEWSASDVSRPNYLERLLFAAAEARDRSSPGEKIVIVVDGLDESAAPPGQNVMGLPRLLPPGVHLIVSKRPVHVVLEFEAPRLPVRLESAAPSNLDDARRFLELVAAREPVSALLAESDVAADDFVATLLERSQGVWIYLHYVLQEIERGERRPLDLAALPYGLWPYYAKYWQRRRDQPEWQTLELALRATLAAAQEDISAALLCAFAGVAETARASRYLEEWRPFLASSTHGGERRYRCYHASFREFLEGKADRDRLTEPERRFADELAEATAAAHNRIADRALGAWGGFESGLEGLQDPRRRDLDDGYALRHLVAHLQGAGRVRDLSRVLCTTRRKEESAENVWYAVHETTKDLGGYLSDVDRVWSFARAAADASIARNEPAATVTLEARCALLHSSVRALAESVGPRMIAALVEKRIWEPLHALRYAWAIGTSDKRLLAMVHLLPLLRTPLREQAFEEAVATARWASAEAFAALPADLPEALLEGMLGQVFANTYHREEKLSAFVPKLSAELIATVVSFVDTADPKADLSELLLALIPLVPAEQREALVTRAREAAERRYFSDRMKFLLRLSRFLPSDERARITADALRQARAEKQYWGASLLALALPNLSGRERLAVAREAIDAATSEALWRLDDILEALIPQLPANLLPLAEKRFLSKGRNTDSRLRFFLAHWANHPKRVEKALARIEKDWYWTGEALPSLVPFLPDRLVSRALSAALRHSGASAAIDALTPRLSSAELTMALSAILARGVSAELPEQRQALLDVDDRQRAERAAHEHKNPATLLRLAASAPPEERTRLTERALELVRAKRLGRNRLDGRKKAELLAKIAMLSQEPDRHHLLSEVIALAEAGALDEFSEKVSIDLFRNLVPHLSEPLLRRALAWAAKTFRGGNLLLFVREIVPRLPEAPAMEVLFFDQGDWHALSPPVADATEPEAGSLKRVVDWLWSLMPQRLRSRASLEQTLLELVRFLPSRARARLLVRIVRENGGWMADETVEQLRHDFSPSEKAALFLEMLPHLSAPDDGSVAGPTLIAALAIQNPSERAKVLESVAEHLHPHFRPALRRAAAAIRKGHGIEDPADEASALTLLAETASADAILRFLDSCSEPERRRLLERAMEIATQIEVSSAKYWLQCQLAPFLPEADGVKIIRYSISSGLRGVMPCIIERWTRRLSPLPEWVAKAILDGSLVDAPEVLIAIAPHLPDPLLQNAIEKTMVNQPWRNYYEALRAIAVRVTELPPAELHDLFEEALWHVATGTTASTEIAALAPILDRLGGDYEL